MRPVNRWNGPANYPAGAYPWSGMPTKVVPATALLTPGAPAPAEYLNYLFYQSQEDRILSVQRAALNAFDIGEYVGAGLRGLSSAGALGGVLYANGTTALTVHSHSAQPGAANKILASGNNACATWGSRSGKFYVFHTVVSTLGAKEVTPSAVNTILALINIDVYPSGIGQIGSDLLLCGAESGALKFYKCVGSTWTAVSLPAGTYVNNAFTTASQQATGVGPIVFTPKGSLISAANYLYANTSGTLLAGSTSGLTSTNYWVGIAWDEVQGLWVACTHNDTGDQMEFATAATPAGPWSDTGITLPDLTHDSKLAFDVKDGVYLVAYSAGAIASGIYPTGFDRPAVTLVASFNQGSLWEVTGASLPAPSDSYLRIVAMPNRVALCNSDGIALSGSWI